MAKNLNDFLTGDLSYDSSWGVYAEKIGGEFTPESPARFGQRTFENGGMLDGKEFFATNEQIVDRRDEYCGNDDDAPDFYSAWAGDYISEVSEASKDLY